MSFRVGELDQRVVIKKYDYVSDGFGGNQKEAVTVGEFWCHVRPLSSKEMFKYDSLQNNDLYLFVFRNIIEIKADYFLEWQSDLFNVRSIKTPKAKSLYIEIDAEKGVAL